MDINILETIMPSNTLKGKVEVRCFTLCCGFFALETAELMP